MKHHNDLQQILQQDHSALLTKVDRTGSLKRRQEQAKGNTEQGWRLEGAAQMLMDTLVGVQYSASGAGSPWESAPCWQESPLLVPQ